MNQFADIPEPTDEEIASLRARCEAQKIEALSPDHVAEALAFLGPDATDGAVVLFFISKHGGSFAEDWERVMSDYNRWVTGICENTEPDPMRCYHHFVGNVPAEELAHHRDRPALGQEP